MAASIPVLRTLFRDLNTISRRYYQGGSNADGTQGSKAAGTRSTKYATENTVTISAGDDMALEATNLKMGNSSENPLRDSYGRILQSKEVMIDVEYQVEDADCQCNQECKVHGRRHGRHDEGGHWVGLMGMDG